MIYDMKTSFQAGVDTLYNACVNKGQTPSSSTPSDIASAIAALVKPSGTKSITSNGTHDVSAYASASVNVPSTVYHNADAITSTSGSSSSSSATTTTRWYKYVVFGYKAYNNTEASIENGTFMKSVGYGDAVVKAYRDVPSGTKITIPRYVAAAFVGIY